MYDGRKQLNKEEFLNGIKKTGVELSDEVRLKKNFRPQTCKSSEITIVIVCNLNII